MLTAGLKARSKTATVRDRGTFHALVGMALALAVPLRAGIVTWAPTDRLVLGGCTAAIVDSTCRFRRHSTSHGLLLGATAAAPTVCSLALGELYAARASAAFYVAADLSGQGAVRLSRGAPTARSVRRGRPPIASSWVRALPELLHGTPLIRLNHHRGLRHAVVFMDRRSALVYEIRMRGLNPRFALYGGVALGRQTLWLMPPAVRWQARGRIMVLAPVRFTDGP